MKIVIIYFVLFLRPFRQMYRVVYVFYILIDINVTTKEKNVDTFLSECKTVDDDKHRRVGRGLDCRIEILF